MGIYGLAYRFMEAALPIGTFITFAIFPLLVREEADRKRRALQIARATDLLLVASVAITVGTIVLAPDLIRALGGDAYAPSVVPLRILVLSLPFTFVGMIMAWTLIARGLQHRLIPIVAGSLTLNLALNIALVPTYSYKASASATLATEALGSFALVYFVHRWLSVSPALGSVVKIVASGGVALGIGLLCAAGRATSSGRSWRSRSSPAWCSRSASSRATRSQRSPAARRSRSPHLGTDVSLLSIGFSTSASRAGACVRHGA